MNRAEFKNTVYKAVSKICDPLENDGLYDGNAHHLAQRLTNAVMKEFFPKLDRICPKCKERMRNRSTLRRDGFVYRYFICNKCGTKKSSKSED